MLTFAKVESSWLTIQRKNFAMTEPHAHDDSLWRLPVPVVAWAPKGDVTVGARLLGAAKDECQECLPGLTAEAAHNGDTLALVVMMAEMMLESPEGRRCVPAPALQGVFDRIRRGRNPDRTAVVEMLRAFTHDMRRDVAAGCVQAFQGYIAGVYEKVDAALLKQQRRPWWVKSLQRQRCGLRMHTRPVARRHGRDGASARPARRSRSQIAYELEPPWLMITESKGTHGNC